MRPQGIVHGYRHSAWRWLKFDVPFRKSAANHKLQLHMKNALLHAFLQTKGLFLRLHLICRHKRASSRRYTGFGGSACLATLRWHAAIFASTAFLSFIHQASAALAGSVLIINQHLKVVFSLPSRLALTFEKMRPLPIVVLDGVSIH